MFIDYSFRFRQAGVLFLFFMGIAVNLACQKEEISSEGLEGTWLVHTLTVDVITNSPDRMEFTFDPDGRFELFFLSGDDPVRMEGEWAYDREEDRLALNYAPRQTILVGLVGFIIGTYSPEESYQVDFTNPDQVSLSGNLLGQQVSLRLERD